MKPLRIRVIATFIVKFLFLSSLNLLYAAPLAVPAAQFYDKIPRVDEHPGYEPLFGHIDFRRIADFAIDQSSEIFDPAWVKQGDIIYVNIWFLEWFEKYVHDQIMYPYILVSCDVGDRVPGLGALNKLLYDPKCAAWFCRNMVFSYHPKLHQIPWGQDIWFFNSSPDAIDTLKEVMKRKPIPKKHLLYMNHFPRKFGDRDKIARMFESAPFCFSRKYLPSSDYVFLPLADYYQELASSLFVLSPLGLETDCLRTWEAFAVDCIPIVEHTFLDPQYEGMPILIIHDWEEITEKFLLEKYQELKGKSREKAYFDYWRKRIKRFQESIRKGDLYAASLEATQFDAKDIQDLGEILEKHGKRELIYRGFLASARPLQLANLLHSVDTIFLYDPWLHPETWSRFQGYLARNKHKIVPLVSDDEFNMMTIFYAESPTFLDLTYYRNGLVRDKTCYRHSLRKDIKSLYRQLQSGTLLFGNMVHDTYVKEVLDLLIKKDGLVIETKGNFWCLLRE